MSYENVPPERLAALSPEQRRLLRIRMQRENKAAGPAAVQAGRPAKPMRFSIFFFSGDEEAKNGEKYRLVLDAARYADKHGLTAVWTPERHFHQFGGLYPSPSVLSAAIAAVTERIEVRAGSVVLPLHHPVRVAEEWAVIDNLSGGRVGVSFASGWSPQDFVFAPDGHADRKETMFRDVDVVRRLWRGDSIPLRSGDQTVEVAIRPRPVQPDLPTWISSVGSGDTCERAGALGLNLLTALLRQTAEQAEKNISAYRSARAAAGHDPLEGQVTVMMHTYLGESSEQVRAAVREPLSAYLATYMDLLHGVADQLDLSVDPARLTGTDRDALVEHALDRYLTANGLFGTPRSARSMVDRLTAAGVDEIACLLDFGLEPDVVMDGLRYIVELRDLVAADAAAGATTRKTAIVGPPETTAPLSLGQERLWFLDRLVPSNAAYNVRSVVRLRGPLDVSLLTRCFEQIVHRHEPLRTSIRILDGAPAQVISRSAELDVRMADTCSGELDGQIQAEITEPFDLSKGALLRIGVFRLSEHEHVLALTMHHIVADGWSVAVVHKELAALYGAWQREPTIPAERVLTPLPSRYAGFAHWQRALLDSDELSRQLSYWRGQLEGAPAMLELPTVGPRPSPQSFAGATHRFTLATEQTRGLRELSKQTGATNFMTLLAVYVVVLAAHSRQRDVVVGSPIANRNRLEFEPLVGLFVNMLALRTDLSGDPTFTQLLGKVRQVSLDAYAHQDCPLEKLIDELGVARSLDHQPLFQAVFVMQSAAKRAVGIPGLDASRYEVDSGTAKFDLVLDITETDEATSGAWEYNRDLYDAETVAALHDDLLAVMTAVLADRQVRVEALCQELWRRIERRGQAATARLKQANQDRLRQRVLDGPRSSGEERLR